MGNPTVKQNETKQNIERDHSVLQGSNSGWPGRVAQVTVLRGTEANPNDKSHCQQLWLELLKKRTLNQSRGGSQSRKTQNELGNLP